jgi:hypothetical protein
MTVKERSRCWFPLHRHFLCRITSITEIGAERTLRKIPPNWSSYANPLPPKAARRLEKRRVKRLKRKRHLV